ncbi:MAG: hypothetical protein NTY19_05915 [Planctomycetota bacterium]|nr:hypothetical protein [Planctomycetota bacterium]
MSTVATTKEDRQLLTFSSTAAYISFLLTCRDTADLGRDTELYQQHLSHVFIPRSGPRDLQVLLRCDAERAQQARHVALANGGTSQPAQSLDRAAFHVLTVSQLLRAIRLQSLPAPTARSGHLLVALWNAKTANLSRFLEYVWNLGSDGVEVAFLRHAGQALPSHIVRIHSLQRPAAFLAFCEGYEGHLELYAPVRTDRRESRFYTRWGYRFPVPGLEQLCDLDRELVLLRPKEDGKSKGTEWLAFAAGEVNFFRRAFEFVDVQVTLTETPLVQLQEDVSPPSVPIELALVTRPKTATTRLWQVDKQIDKQRRILLDMERLRANLAAGQLEEVYFAYRFEQPDEDYLNPRLARLLQQRIGTLSHYGYAFCRPLHGPPYHVVIANRTQRQLGFSLQLADRVYYQPAAWRGCGVNLFLPLHAELAPQIDDNDALPLLQRILDHSEKTGGRGADAAECAAILWETGREGEIEETRVSQSTPLLSQFRLLNLFQRRSAREVGQASRNQLAEGLREARQHVEDQLDLLTRELWEYVSGRTAKLETSYHELEEDLQAAELLVARIEPRITEIRQLVLTLPGEWFEFVNAVLALQQSLADPQLAALRELREQRQVGRQQLQALAVCGRDLTATAEKHRELFVGQLAESEPAIAGDRELHEQLEQLHARAMRVFREIRTLHQQYQERFARTKEMEKKANQMQAEIDQIQALEAKVKRRYAELVPLLAEYQQKAVEINNQQEEVTTKEQLLLKQGLEFAQRREELKQRALQLAGQLQQIEVYLNLHAARSEQISTAAAEVTEQLDLARAYREAVEMWETQQKSWENHLATVQEEETRQIARIQSRLDELGTDDQNTAGVREQLDQAQQHLAKAESLRGRRKGSPTP